MRRHELKHLAPLAIALPFIMFLVAPLSVYFGNISALHFGLADVLGPVLVFCGASALFLFVLLVAASLIKPLFLTVRGLLLGLAIAAWVQSHILVWQLGPLTGGPIFWEQVRSLELMRRTSSRSEVDAPPLRCRALFV